MLLGNLASILITIAGILQVLSWTIAGAMILVILSIATLAPSRGPGSGAGAGHSTNRKTGHYMVESKPSREKSDDKQTPRPHQPPSRLEQRPVPKIEPPRTTEQPRKPAYQKVVNPNIAQ